ncbi:NAD(P)H-binding protein [Kibdelosporangium persicum]|uniref:Nucleoside-diphosphate sugar epimerase n=1 Tax=Kibdelosporangium persicum TaxID=2698649 RepID=A0ABX2F0U8_9PSEU|nr:NAD(P)H-binding protein [Kibdelosporangium persicum]NRN64754.1 putative nucleoside-diphosphate sugar epimerase [Kibdelosporangium persicum]
MTIVVVGGTGKTGSPLVRTLRERGESVRVASRSASGFDWSKQDTWAAALDGASAVYLIAPYEPESAGLFVKQATSAGVRRFVVLSARDIDKFPAEYFQGMAAAEQAVRDSGAEWTIIRPNNFSQNFSDPSIWRNELVAGRLALPIGDVAEPFIDAQDIAEVAAVLLTSDGHHGQVYTLSGPRALTFADAVAAMASASGRTIRYEEISPEEYREALVSSGASEEAAAELDALFAAMRAGLYAEPRDGVRQVLGRDPLDFDTYVAREVSAWS